MLRGREVLILQERRWTSGPTWARRIASNTTFRDLLTRYAERPVSFHLRYRPSREAFPHKTQPVPAPPVFPTQLILDSTSDAIVCQTLPQLIRFFRRFIVGRYTGNCSVKKEISDEAYDPPSITHQANARRSWKSGESVATNSREGC